MSGTRLGACAVGAFAAGAHASLMPVVVGTRTIRSEFLLRSHRDNLPGYLTQIEQQARANACDSDKSKTSRKHL